MFSLPIAASIVLLLVHLEKEQVAGLVVPAGRDLLLPFLFISSPFDCSTLLGKNHSPPHINSFPIAARTQEIDWAHCPHWPE